MIGKLFTPAVKGPYRHPRVWTREPTDERERLRIGAGVGTLTLLRALSAEVAEPLGVRVVLHAPRAGDGVTLERDGVPRPELDRFLDRFAGLFEDDARAQLWIAQVDGPSLLVLDEHDLIYAYGPLHKYEEVLRAHSYRTGEAIVPEPHEHRSSPEFDEDERILRTWWDWRSRPIPGAEQLGVLESR